MEGKMDLSKERDYQFRIRLLSISGAWAHISVELLDKEGLVQINMGSGDVPLGGTLTIADAHRAFELTIA